MAWLLTIVSQNLTRGYITSFATSIINSQWIITFKSTSQKSKSQHENKRWKKSCKRKINEPSKGDLRNLKRKHDNLGFNHGSKTPKRNYPNYLKLLEAEEYQQQIMPLNDFSALSIASINLDADSFPPSAPKENLSFLCWCICFSNNQRQKRRQ